ncbi:sn-glycerol-3-phosphate ABC transporter ATP-binding protein UgpC [Rhizobium calliandrae]|uniref:Sn-glycerol-3-phosphate ABC transporter ATP-binding protein UgpC n=1 Tax=Rhizobium calliandrae TaxID=1312182 RepID=A0ABT7KHE2_9HYPH|nr:sn-glycerol-3-phosphate ABC transporter ATP-binding protein UgpC [Rhizobium calliandrae]MDL2408060.1 sn-glycerol-3-phosphate ABC transporter ATP-binding protein UgpC [Rhizobium calliandrae]
MAEVELKHICKSFGQVDIIKDLDLTIDHGEFCVLVGPSGCGKSTLLRMIAGLESVSRGELFIDRDLVNEVDPVQRGIAMVFQSYALYPHMTVAENMGFSLKMAGEKKGDIHNRVTAAAAILQLTHLLERRPSQLSGGQRQRVAIGRAIVRNPKVFLFDEPLSNLDAELRVSMRVEIAKLHMELGNTMIYVTHDQTEAMTLADKIVVLRAGRIEQVGAPLQLYDDPDNLFVAGFIGSPKMNFLDAEASGPRSVRCADGTKLSMAGLSAPLSVGQKVTIGIRPEHLKGRTDADLMLPVTVDVVEHLGTTTYAYAHTTAGQTITVELGDERTVRTGDRLELRFAAADLRVFGQKGERLR